MIQYPSFWCSLFSQLDLLEAGGVHLSYFCSIFSHGLAKLVKGALN